jgi:hypothetical protein
MANMGRLARHEFDKMSLPPEESNLPSQVSILTPIFLTKNIHCSIVNFLSPIGRPR